MGQEKSVRTEVRECTGNRTDGSSVSVKLPGIRKHNHTGHCGGDQAPFSVTFEFGMSKDFPKPGPEMSALQNPAEPSIPMNECCRPLVLVRQRDGGLG